ncbi:hypothetical protein E2C01_034174 [Portunus trituberculatus]|uniref:Uncharacterized protein n=1 Tax=Portunus trituberculatus TaxID=210409 RepID=A0A5B7F0S1_PORTR|nr:hypothetical protein [Portunus trituberculatus]
MCWPTVLYSSLGVGIIRKVVLGEAQGVVAVLSWALQAILDDILDLAVRWVWESPRPPPLLFLRRMGQRGRRPPKHPSMITSPRAITAEQKGILSSIAQSFRVEKAQRVHESCLEEGEQVGSPVLPPFATPALTKNSELDWCRPFLCGGTVEIDGTKYPVTVLRDTGAQQSVCHNVTG